VAHFTERRKRWWRRQVDRIWSIVFDRVKKLSVDRSLAEQDIGNV
jgi:hypothetical protein